MFDPGSARVGKKYARKQTQLEANGRLYGTLQRNPKFLDAE